MKLPAHLSTTDPRVEMMPLIDVMFLVLVAFIYASLFMSANYGLPVDLPESSEAEPVLSGTITLAILPDGSLMLNQQAVSIEQLGTALVKAKSDVDRDVTIYIRADRDARVDPLVKVMDVVRQAGITGLTIAADRILDDSDGK